MFKMWCATVADTPSAGEAGQGGKKIVKMFRLAFCFLMLHNLTQHEKSLMDGERVWVVHRQLAFPAVDTCMEISA